jgi:hypothetical protein
MGSPWQVTLKLLGADPHVGVSTSSAIDDVEAGSYGLDDDEVWYSALGSLPEVLGPSDLPKLNEGLRYLFKELRDAQATFIRGSDLDGAYLSLVAVYAFMSLFQTVGTDGLMVPLMALESALWALDEGVTEPLLRPVRQARAGRPRAPQLRQEFLGTVVFTIQQLRAIGYSLPEAHKLVADDLNRVGAKPDRGSNRFTPRTVRDWCERVAEDVGCHLPAAQRSAALSADPRSAALRQMPPKVAAAYLRYQFRRSAVLLGMAPRAGKPT